MNKVKVNELIPLAYEVLEQVKNEIEKDGKIVKIVNGGKIDKAYRSQISTFGVAVTTGSLLAAIAFFSAEESGSKVDRILLMKAICCVLTGKKDGIKSDKLYKYVYNKIKVDKIKESKIKEDVINATIAIKLAMNLYVLEEK